MLTAIALSHINQREDSCGDQKNLSKIKIVKVALGILLAASCFTLLSSIILRFCHVDLPAANITGASALGILICGYLFILANEQLEQQRLIGGQKC